MEILLHEDVRIAPYESVMNALAQLPEGATLYLDAGRTNCTLYKQLPSHISCKEGMNLTTLPKALKNETEIEHIRKVMVKDGVAMVKFLIWLESSVGNISLMKFG